MDSDNPDRLQLLEGEKVLTEIKPHVLAFWDMYLIWVWIIALSAVFAFYGDQLSWLATDQVDSAAGMAETATAAVTDGFFGRIPYVGGYFSPAKEAVSSATGFVREYTAVGLWIAALFVSALVVSVFKIEFKWLALMVGVGLVSVALAAYLGLSGDWVYFIGGLLSLVGILFVESYREAHTFYVTDMRIVTEVRFGSTKRNELSFDKINNIVLDQGLFGSIFNFATIIPVTASGLGMGSDFSAVSVGAQGQRAWGTLGAQVTGGRTVQTPRARSMYCLFGVSDPESVQNLLSERMHAHVQAPYLKRMTEQLDDIKKSVGGA
jgi:hypothetical protein